MMQQAMLVLVRHGQSTANAEGLFTGLLDVPLTELGREEAVRAADLLARAGIDPRVRLTSPLQRARTTTEILIEQLDGRASGGVESDWRLAERNYGALTGRRKVDVLAEYGEAQYLAWRRSVHIAPPRMTRAQFASLGDVPAWLGRTEALDAVIRRTAAFWRARIEPCLRLGKDVLVVAHGNSLRALCAVLDKLDDAEIEDLNIPTGQPLIYRIGDQGSPRVRGGEDLDPESAADAAAAYASE